MSVQRIAFSYSFNDQDWLGGKNYFSSLFTAIERINPTGYEWVFVTGKKTSTTLPNQFPWLKTYQTSLLDRLSPAWLVRQITLRTFGADPLFSYYLDNRGVSLLSHSGPLVHGWNVKSLPWLYDFQFMHLPEYWHPKHIKWAIKRYKMASRYSDGLIVSSHDAERDLKQFDPNCKIPCHVLQFVSNPVDFVRLPTKEKVLQKYGLPDNYIYLPNQFWKNKNHKLVIDALAVLKQNGNSVSVVCSGKTFDGRQPEYFNELMQYRDSVGVVDEFKVLGVVPYNDLQGLMAHANAVLNPSKFEGWSTTVEEAKTLQRNLLLSNIAVHEEQAPNNAKFFSPDDVKVLADLLVNAANNGCPPLDVKNICEDYDRRLENFGRAFLKAALSVLQKNRN